MALLTQSKVLLFARGTLKIKSESRRPMIRSQSNRSSSEWGGDLRENADSAEDRALGHHVDRVLKPDGLKRLFPGRGPWSTILL